MSILRNAALLALPLTLALIVGCSASSSSAMAVREYAEWCVDRDSLAGLDEADLATWGDAADHLADQLAEFRRIDPPPTVAPYHSASTAALELLVAHALDHDPGSEFEPMSLIGAGLTYALPLAEADLSLQTRQALIATGCLEGGLMQTQLRLVTASGGPHARRDHFDLRELLGLDAIEHRLDRLERGLDAIEHRLDRLERVVRPEAMPLGYRDLVTWINAIEYSLDQLEQEGGWWDFQWRD